MITRRIFLGASAGAIAAASATTVLPRLAMALLAFQRALADERPFVDQMGLKREFFAEAA